MHEHAEPVLESLVDGKQEFGDKEIVQSCVVLESLLVVSNCDEELLETCGADAFIT
jgi:hypothetical protein